MTVVRLPTGPARLRLSPRERDVLLLTARGMTYREVAERWVVADGTVKKHRTNLLAKLEARNMTMALAQAILHGLITTDDLRSEGMTEWVVFKPAHFRKAQMGRLHVLGHDGHSLCGRSMHRARQPEADELVCLDRCSICAQSAGKRSAT